MVNYYLAIDIGASSGRMILGFIDNQKIKIEEVHRFENKLTKVDDSLCWDYTKLFDEIIKGLRRCQELNKIPTYIGIDTWAVDFVLLDESGSLTSPMVSYRDDRTIDIDLEVELVISSKDLYERTGIQKQMFNTIYQLMAIKQKDAPALENAVNMLMVPDYFNYLLTGIAVAEYTNATSTNLVSKETRDWDRDLIRSLEIPETIFPNIMKPGTVLGDLKPEIVQAIGFNAEVVLPPTHDTASAILSVPSHEKDFVYLSSGTWSLLGTEIRQPIVSSRARELNFTNEGGYDGKLCFLKNIMGMWLIQSIRKELTLKMNRDISYNELADLAAVNRIDSTIDCNDARFFAPNSMLSEIETYLKETSQDLPQSIGEFAYMIYNSLAISYAKTIVELESLTGKRSDKLYVVGGGSQVELVNRLTAEKTGCTVYAGPIEATALGNLGAQMMASGELKDVSAFRDLIAQSFSIKTYQGGKV